MTAPFPRIVRFTGTSDAGEFGAAQCPHCGAPGRYVHSFTLEDGRNASAMSGCLKLFPVSPIALEEKRLREKAASHARKGWKLNRADLRALEAIESFYAGQIAEVHALSVVNAAKASNVARFKRRR